MSSSFLAGAPEEDSLTRFFSIFPGGRPGAGLFLLRGSVGVAILWLSFWRYGGVSALAGMEWILALSGYACGLSLLVGFMTSPVALGIALLALGIVLNPPEGKAMHNGEAVFLAAVAGSVALLGPGAWSVDARLFGRREIIIPPSSSGTPE